MFKMTDNYPFRKVYKTTKLECINVIYMEHTEK